MNFGRFFRLNQSLSKVVDGVAIYDYIELPAYFGPSEENKMSPKYPVSVTITANSVRFRLHYSVYKVGTDLHPEYGYSVDDIHQAMDGSTKGIKMAHMEEVIFELPYINDATDRLASTIKELYSTKFPQRIDDNRAEGSNSSGGRFLEQLIKKRFPLKGEGETDSIKNSLYKSMREALDKLPSYSSLWLMDLIKGEGKDQYVDVFEKAKGKSKEDNDRNIDGFLRKLLLDFMFDLKHSDVFQNSTDYQRMYSGLMSNFFFSALMHKCEYYYYRQLIKDEIENEVENEKTEDNKKDRIKVLYAEELFKAEELWTKDIMSPLADKWFKSQKEKSQEGKSQEGKSQEGKSQEGKSQEEKSQEEKSQEEKSQEEIKDSKLNWCERLLSNFDLYECGITNKVNAWFADPEEEMKRVCFPMWEEKEKNDCHLCNADVLTAYLKLEEKKTPDGKPEEEKKTDEYEHLRKRLLESRDNNREQISRWFLLRYDFLDVIHLHSHLSDFTNLFMILGAMSAIVIIYFTPFIQKEIPSFPIMDMLYRYAIPIVVALIGIGLYCGFPKHKHKEDNCLLKIYDNIGRKKVKYLFMGTVFVIAIILFTSNIIRFLLVSIFMIGVGLYMYIKGRDKLGSSAKILIAGLHLFLPRLVASIATAWLTIAMAYDFLNSFFDKMIPWGMIFFIMIIPLGFVLYEINRITLHNLIWKKISRAFELLLISYCISIMIGIVAIDFVGPNFMERGGYIDDFYLQYNAYEGNASSRVSPLDDNVPIAKMVSNNEKAKEIKETLKKKENIESKITKLVSNNESLKKQIKEALIKKERINRETVKMSPHDTSFKAWVSKKDSNEALIKKLMLKKAYNEISLHALMSERNANDAHLESLLPYTQQKKVEYLTKVEDKDGTPILCNLRIGSHNIFFMRNFLFTFSFLAVFIGIFLQMMFFETKQMTEL